MTGTRNASPQVPAANRERRKVALMVARWFVWHGYGTDTVIEECAHACGCTPDMMRLVLPQLLREEMEMRRK